MGEWTPWHTPVLPGKVRGKLFAHSTLLSGRVVPSEDSEIKRTLNPLKHVLKSVNSGGFRVTCGESFLETTLG